MNTIRPIYYNNARSLGIYFTQLYPASSIGRLLMAYIDNIWVGAMQTLNNALQVPNRLGIPRSPTWAGPLRIGNPDDAPPANEGQSVDGDTWRQWEDEVSGDDFGDQGPSSPGPEAGNRLIRA